MTALTKGSRALQARLAKIHANNPEFQAFVKKHGFGGNLSVKQSGTYNKQSTSIASVKPVTNASPDTTIRGKTREDHIRQAAERIRQRKLAGANRAAFGGELGGDFTFPRSRFRRYSEEFNPIMLESSMKKKIILGKLYPQLPGPKDGFPTPKGFERVKDLHGFNVLRKYPDNTKETISHKLNKVLDMKKHEISKGFGSQSWVVEKNDNTIPFDPDPPKKNLGVVVGKKPAGYSRARWLARMARDKMEKQGKVEDATMNNKKRTLNELRKATLAAYIQKAAPRIRSGTSLGKNYDDEAYGSLKIANKHSKYVFDPADPEGKNKDLELGKRADAEYKTSMGLSADFHRSARNRIKGVQRAAARLAKEEIVVEGENPYGSGFKLVHSKTGKVFKVGDKFKDDRETHTILGWQHGSQRGNPSSSGRVRVRVDGVKGWEQEFFPHVFGMKVVKEETNESTESNIVAMAKQQLREALKKKK